MLEVKPNQNKLTFNLVQRGFRFASTYLLNFNFIKIYVKFLLHFEYTFMLDCSFIKLCKVSSERTIQTFPKLVKITIRI